MNVRLLGTLAAAQFLMVLDQAVMNVSISQLVEDFDTTVTTIQSVIAFYALVMAGLMLTGGKLGDIFGRKRTFKIGLVIYAAGSALTAASWSARSGYLTAFGIARSVLSNAVYAWTSSSSRTRLACSSKVPASSWRSACGSDRSGPG